MSWKLALGGTLFVAVLATAAVRDPAEIAPLAQKSLLLDAAWAKDTAVAVGERGHILYSEDFGQTWQQARVPLRSHLTAVSFIDQQLGWAVGHDSTILRTVDGGRSWHTIVFDPEEDRPLLDVWFRDVNNGVAVGAYGMFLESSDAGASWRPGPRVSDDDFHLNQLQLAEDGTWYMAAEAGALYRSDDQGVSWMALESPYEGSFFGILPIGESVLAFGLRGHLFRSDDRGESWTRIETNTVAMLTSALQLDDRRIVITGLEGTLLLSEDAGRTFTRLPFAERIALMKALVSPDGHLLLFGEGGVRRIDPLPLATK